MIVIKQILQSHVYVLGMMLLLLDLKQNNNVVIVEALVSV